MLYGLIQGIDAGFMCETGEYYSPQNVTYEKKGEKYVGN